MKQCKACLQTFELSDFYERASKCKECTKAAVRRNRLAKVDYYRAYDRARGVGARNQYWIECSKKWIRERPEVRAAHIAVGNAVRDGRLYKPGRCSCCLATLPKRMIQGHHEDYSKPLEVVWLCMSCHKKHHANTEQKAG